jgi:sugar/nucleoside kinase (ribokinase family)
MPSLLIVGGLTVDHFADGTRAPGGSVLHAGLAAAAEGAEITILTVAGDEPEAQHGLDRLATLGSVLRRRAAATTTYAHREVDGLRVLTLEAASEPIDPAVLAGHGPFDVALLAPIADELPPAAVAALRDAARPLRTVFLIQGWLRRLLLREPVRALAIHDVPDELWQAFGSADAVVVSTEDLEADPGDAFTQAAAVRARLGPAPVLVLTLGAEGYLLDDPAADRVVASVPRHVVEGVPAVGAGDTFGAALAIHLARGEDPAAAAVAATERVIAVLESRSRA